MLSAPTHNHNGRKHGRLFVADRLIEHVPLRDPNNVLLWKGKRRKENDRNKPHQIESFGWGGLEEK